MPTGSEYAVKTFTFATLFIVCVALFLTPSASAEIAEDDFSYLKFSGGLLASYAVHEAAHLLAGAATNTTMSWEPGTYNQPLGFNEYAKTDKNGTIINASGLISQAIASETILRMDKLDKNSSFVRGMMAWNIINPIVYSLDYWLIKQSNRDRGDSYQGDLKGIEHYSGKSAANTFAVSASALALCHAYRYLKTQDWAPEWAKRNSYFLPMSFPWGLGIGFRYDF